MGRKLLVRKTNQLTVLSVTLLPTVAAPVEASADSSIQVDKSAVTLPEYHMIMQPQYSGKAGSSPMVAGTRQVCVDGCVITPSVVSCHTCKPEVHDQDSRGLKSSPQSSACKRQLTMHMSCAT